MVFSSSIFVFLFLPLFLGLYYLTPLKYRSLTILLASLIFYGWWRIDFLCLIFAVVLWNFGFSRAMVKAASVRKKKILIIGVTLNLLTLGFFKYFNFGVESMNAILNASGFASIAAMQVILPIGISFYMFQAISFLVDVYRGDAKPPKRFIDFAAFITMFPQLIAGPILRYKDLAGQFENRTHSMDNFSEGARRFMIGFSKKVLIADTIAPLADAAFALENPSTADAWIGALAYTVQLYFDFSGYSCMAIGIGLMMGFRFIENFNSPYRSASISEFWRRWHISLSTWLRDYLYIPLGGNRNGTSRTYRNLILTMVLGGLWHGANLTFILWGTFHGVIMSVERALGIKGKVDQHINIRRIVAIALTFILVLLGWVIFRSPDIATAINIYGAMFMLSENTLTISDDYAWQIKGVSLSTLIIGGIIILFGPYLKNTFTYSHKIMPSLIISVVFFIAASRLISNNYSPFLYFQF